MNHDVKYVLDETRLPKRWYNLIADLPSPPPPGLHPGTLEPVGPDDLAPLFPLSLIRQEVSTEREIETLRRLSLSAQIASAATARSIASSARRPRWAKPSPRRTIRENASTTTKPSSTGRATSKRQLFVPRSIAP